MVEGMEEQGQGEGAGDSDEVILDVWLEIGQGEAVGRVDDGDGFRSGGRDG